MASQVNNYLEKVKTHLKAGDLCEIHKIKLELETILFKSDFLKNTELLASVFGFRKPQLFRDVNAESYIPSKHVNKFIALRYVFFESLFCILLI